MEYCSRYFDFLCDSLLQIIWATGSHKVPWFRRLERPKTISSLPPELICEILLYMNMQELFSLKMTSRIFYDATKARHFWQRVLCSLRPVYNRPNFWKRLYSCTPEEIEHWGMKSLRNYECWALDIPLTFQSHSFDYSTPLIMGAIIHEAELLPGGRWLVASSSRGQYLLYDLHSPSPQPRELFDPREHDHKDKTRDCLDSFVTWIKPTTDGLCFRIAVWKWNGPTTEGYVTRTYIYEIKISEDERGIRLSTRRHYSARSYIFRRRRPSISISDKYLVEARKTGYGPENTVRWKLFLCQYSSDDQGKPSMDVTTVLLGKTDDSAVEKVFVTSDDHVVTIGTELIAIYTISHLAQCNKQRASPLHRIQLDGTSVSAPFPDRGYHWMVALRDDEFWLIRLSKDTISPPRVVKLGRNPLEPDHEWSPSQVTQDATICRYPDWTAKVLTYSWDVEMTQCTFKAKIVFIPKIAESPGRLVTVGVDMANGRLVYLDGVETNLTILDTM